MPLCGVQARALLDSIDRSTGSVESLIEARSSNSHPPSIHLYNICLGFTRSYKWRVEQVKGMAALVKAHKQ